MPGDDVAEQEPADQRRVVPEQRGHLGRAARERHHPYGVGRRHLVKPVRRSGVHRLPGPLQPGQEPPVIGQRFLTPELPAGGSGASRARAGSGPGLAVRVGDGEERGGRTYTQGPKKYPVGRAGGWPGGRGLARLPYLD